MDKINQQSTIIKMSNTNEQIVKDLLFLRFSQILINEEGKAGKFKIPIHLALGHEAIAVAINRVLKDGDKLVLSHRNIEFNLMQCGKLRPILDEYLLKSDGIMGGRLGSMNLINPAKGIIYSSSILGNNFSVAQGIAMAHKLRSESLVTFVFGGDGSIEEGSFYENILNAKSWGTSLVFLIENNEWSLGTHISERRHEINLEKLCGSLEVPYLKIQGNSVSDYIEVISELRKSSLENMGPICAEISVKTLGDWKAEDGRYINYHAGLARTIDLVNLLPVGGIIKESDEDPLFVISKTMDKKEYLELSKTVLNELKNEIR